MSETKDQTIARLEAEVGRYGTELAIKLSTIARLEGELADLQHIDKVADHANEVIGLMQKDIDDLTAELAATRADAYERAAASMCKICADGHMPEQSNLNKTFYWHLEQFCSASPIRALITSTDAAARDELLIRCKSCGGTLRYKRTQEGYEVYHDCIYGERGTAPRNIFRGKPNA